MSTPVDAANLRYAEKQSQPMATPNDSPSIPVSTCEPREGEIR